jgi:hypothetical protein
MSRVLRRGFSLWTRPNPPQRVARSAVLDGNEAIQMQRVRIRKRFLTRSRIIGAVVFTSVGYELFKWLDEEVGMEEEVGYSAPRTRPPGTGKEEDVTGTGVDDEEEDEDDDVVIFLPTGLSRPKPKTFYKGSDPEWKEFSSVAKDRKRLERIQNELVTMVRGHMEKVPGAVMRLGKINTSTGSKWLEVKFPDGPPVEFERPGIEITDDLTVRRGTQPVDPVSHFRLTNALFPTVVANSLYADSKLKLTKQWVSWKNYLGWEATDKQSQLSRILTPPVLPSPPPANAPSPTSPTVSGSVTAPTPSNGTQQASSPPSTSPPQKSDTAATPYVLPLPGPKDIALDLSTFHKTFTKEIRVELAKIEPPRGSFLISGLIEVRGTRAKMTLDVVAAYDPKAGKYVMIRLHPRSVTDFRQVPKGGP